MTIKLNENKDYNKINLKNALRTLENHTTDMVICYIKATFNNNEIGLLTMLNVPSV